MSNASKPGRAASPALRSAPDRVRLLVRVGRIAASDLEPDEMLDRTADAIHELLGYENVDLPLLEPGEPAALVIRARGGRYKEIGRVDRLPIDRGVMGAAAREGRTQRVDDVAADPRYVHPPSGFNVQAELAVPIVHAGRVLGVVNVEGSGPFDELDVEILEFVADHVGLAIEKARLLDSARRVAVLEERQRLARELHDSVTQLLFSANLLAESIGPGWERDPAEGRRRLDRLRKQVRQALSEMRALLRELAPKSSGADFSSREFPPPAVALLHREGLVTVLTREAQALERAGVAVELHAGLRTAVARARGGPPARRAGGARQRRQARARAAGRADARLRRGRGAAHGAGRRPWLRCHRGAPRARARADLDARPAARARGPAARGQRAGDGDPGRGGAAAMSAGRDRRTETVR